MPLALDDVLVPARPEARRPPEDLRLDEPIGRFVRLAEIAANLEGSLAVDVRLSFGQGGLPRLEGRVQGTLELTCQRCLGPLREEIDVSFRLALVGEGSEAAVPAGFEAWELPAGAERPPRLRDLIEDEIILALPLIARHAERVDCGELPPELNDGQTDDDADTRTTGREASPFSVLRDIKRPE
jgi:uncharacterized protein